MSNKSDAAAEVAGRNETARLHANWITAEHPRFVDDRKAETALCPVQTHSQQSIEAAPAPHRAKQHPAHLWWVYAFLISLVLPVETSVFIGPLRLAPYRLLLIAFLVPGLVMLFSGRVGRFGAADGCMILHALWAALALLINNGIGGGLEPAGIYVIEVIGSYLIGRCCIRSAEDFRRVVWVLFWLVALLLPFALFEGITGKSIIHNAFRALGGGPSLEDGEKRLGLTRAFASFDHPILYGVFCAATLSLVFYGLRGKLWQRLTRSTVVVGAAFFSLSSAPLLALGLQFGLIAWDFATRRLPYRWALLSGGFAAAYVAVDILSTRSPFLVLSSYLTFDAQTGYMRTYIWHYASADVLRHPLFGIGGNDWARPDWMPPSVDNFWLVTALRSGLPAFAFLAFAVSFMFYSLARRYGISDSISEVRTGLIFSLIALIFAGGTVHFWNSSFCVFIFLIGSGYGMGKMISALSSQPGRSPELRDSSGSLTFYSLRGQNFSATKKC